MAGQFYSALDRTTPAYSSLPESSSRRSRLWPAGCRPTAHPVSIRSLRSGTSESTRLCFRRLSRLDDRHRPAVDAHVELERGGGRRFLGDRRRELDLLAVHHRFVAPRPDLALDLAAHEEVVAETRRRVVRIRLGRG